MNKIDKKLLSLMTIEERFKYIQKKKIHEFNKNSTTKIKNSKRSFLQPTTLI